MEPTRDPLDRRPALTADNFVMLQKAVPNSGVAPSPKVSVSDGGTSAAVDSDFVATTGRQPKEYKLAFDGPGSAATGSIDDQGSIAPSGSVPDHSLSNAIQSAGPALVDQGALLEQLPMDRMNDEELPQPKRLFSRRRLLGISLLFLGCLAAIVLGLRIEANKSKAQNSSLTSPSSRLQQQRISLTTLGKQLGASPVTSNAVTVNGQLQVTGSLVLQPSTETGPAVTGQMYYDSTTNALAYYNGTRFVMLQGGGNTYTTSVAGNTSNVTNISNTTNITNVSGGFGGTGTPGTLALFASSTTLGNSMLAQSGTSLVTSATAIQGSDASGLSIMTDSAAGSSGGITIESGTSSTVASGNVTVDTGAGIITGEVVGNKTFEDGVDNMLAWFGDTIAQSNAEAHSGSESLAMTTTSAFWGMTDDANNQSLEAPVIAGHHYYFSAWVRAGTTPRQINGSICWNGTTCDDIPLSTVTDSTAAWTEMTGTAVAPGGTVRASWSFYGSGSAVGEVHYFDDLVVTDLSSSSSVSELNLGAANAQFVNIGNMNEIGATTIDGSSGITLASGAGPISATGGAITVSGNAASSFATSSGTLTLGAGGGTGGNGVIVTTQANSTSAFSVQDASASTTLLNVDTTDSAISLGVGGGVSFGNTRLGTVASGVNIGSIGAGKFTTGTTAGAIASMSVWVGVPQSGSNFQVAIYSNNAGSPGSYIASSAVTAIGTSSGTWYTVPISATLSPSTTYWLVFWSNISVNDDNRLSFASAIGTWYQVASSWQGGPDNGMPTSIPTGGTVYSNTLASIYATYVSGQPALTINSNGLLTENGAALFQDPTDSTQALQIQSAEGSTLFTADTADMTITVTGSLTVSGSITVDGHIVAGGSTPTIAANATACTGTAATASITGTDTAGTITINSGTSCSSGTLATITFANAFGATPIVVLTPGSPISQTLGAYVDDSTISTTKFDLGTNATPLSSQAFKWNYQVIQ